MKATNRGGVGILGVGAYLPPEVRTNDWWPAGTVREWEQRAVLSQKRIEAVPDEQWRPGERAVLAAMRGYLSDPFRGAVERRVMPEGMRSSDMEYEACRIAIERAGIRPDEIDVVLNYSFVPDELLCANAFPLHERLGLSRNCFTSGIEAACNSFLIGLTMAESMIRSGIGRNVLLVQSCGISRILPPEEPTSAWFGDGAAAVVVGPVAADRGIIGRATRTVSSLHRGVVTGVKERAWYEDGRSWFFAKDRSAAFRIMVGVADDADEIIGAALGDAGLERPDVSFFACHQIAPWMRSTVQAFTGLERARSVETFHWAGNLASVNVPLVLSIAERDGLLRDGDVVALYGGGAGVTFSSSVLRWSS